LDFSIKTAMDGQPSAKARAVSALREEIHRRRVAAGEYAMATGESPQAVAAEYRLGRINHDEGSYMATTDLR
jgi:hypothetical protein